GSVSSRRTWPDFARCSSVSSRSSARWTVNGTNDRGGGSRGAGADPARPGGRDHPRHRARGARRRGERGDTYPVRRHPRVSVVDGGEPRGRAAGGVAGWGGGDGGAGAVPPVCG